MNSKKSPSLKQFLNHCSEILDDARRFCFIARDSELQRDMCDRLTQLLHSVAMAKDEVIAKQDEDFANLLLAVECEINAIRSEIEMWIALKQDKANQAWDYLINAQDFACCAISAHPFASTISDYVVRLQEIERLIFPRQTFMSTGLIVGRSECTICREEYEDCPHVKGRPYMGQFCTIEVMDVEQLLEVSIVDEPASRHCRITHAGNLDVMTLKTVDRPLRPSGGISEAHEQSR